MPPLLERRRLHQRIVETSQRYPVTAVLGARQMGKTALVRLLASSRDHFFDLESPEDQVRLSENAFGVLADLTGRVIIDEAQRQPDLFPILRVLADRPEMPARFVITGSVSPELLQLELEHLYVVHPGNRRWNMGDRIEAVGIEQLSAVCLDLRAGRG